MSSQKTSIPDQPGVSDNLPLHAAVRSNHSGVVRTLLEQRSDPNLRDSAGETPLHICCRMGNLPLLEILLLEERVDPNIQSMSGETPLHLIAGKDPQMIIRLLEHGADPNISDVSCNLPAHIAIQEGNLACLKAILEHSTFAPSPSPYPNSLMEATRKAGQPEMEAYLFQWEISLSRPHHMHLLARAGKWSEAEKMIAQDRALVEIPDDFGRTPLHIAAWLGDLEGVLLFLDAGADPNSRMKPSLFEDPRFIAPLHFSIAKGFVDLSTALIDRGATVTDLQEPIFLEKVIRSKNHAFLETLLKKGIPPNPAKPGRYPLWVAGEENNLEMVKLLLKYRADPNHPKQSSCPIEDVRSPVIKKLLREHGVRVPPGQGAYICKLCGKSYDAGSTGIGTPDAKEIEIGCSRCGARICSYCSYTYEMGKAHVKKICLDCYRADPNPPET